MGEGVPAIADGRSLDADAARAALVEVGATRDLDAILARCAEILLQRFDADMALVYAARPGRKLWGAPTSGPLAVDTLFSIAETFNDPEFVERLKTPGSALRADLASLDDPTRGQRAIASVGIRSTMWAALDGGIAGKPIGFIFVGSRSAGRFHERDLQELRTLGMEITSFAQPAVLLEERRHERELMTEEAQLLAAMTEAENERDLLEAFTNSIQRALTADASVVILPGVTTGNPEFFGAPAGTFSSGHAEAAREVLTSGDYRSLLERLNSSGAFVVPNLDAAADTPIEAWLRDLFGFRSLACAVRSQHSGGIGLGVAALRTAPGSWTTVETAFLARLTRVLELSIERLRRGAIANERTVELQQHAQLLDAKTRILAVAPREGLDQAGQTFARESHALFGALFTAAAIVKRGEITVIGTAGRNANEPGIREWLATSIAGRLPVHPGIDFIHAPLLDSAGDVKGAVLAASETGANWQEADQKSMEDLASALAQVVERTQLINAAADKTAKVQALTELLSTLSMSSPPQEVATHIARQIRQYLACDGVMVYAFDYGTGERVRIAFDAIAGHVNGPDKVRMDTAAAYIEQQVQPHALFTALDPEASPAWLRDLALRKGFQSAVCVRIDTAGEPLGMVAAGSVDPARMSSDDIESLTAVAAPVGMVLERHAP